MPLIGLRVCVFRPSRMARTISPLKRIGFSATAASDPKLPRVLELAPLPLSTAPRVVLGVVAEVAPLAERGEVLVDDVLRRVIQVRDGQDDARARDRVRLVVLRGAPLAAVPGPLEADAARDGRPVLRVTHAVLRG